MAETRFKIYSLMVVKNEADIIECSLRDACRWSDKVIVLDNGSTDGTWETIQRLGEKLPALEVFGRHEGAFHIGLRARLFKAYRHEMTQGDWWCVRLDADEFFSGDVRAFLSRVPARYRTVSKESHDYLLSRNDIEKLTGDFERDRSVFHHVLPIYRRERRFMRHSPWLIWLERWRYPHPWGLVAPEGIPVEHYQYRSVEQMKTRWQTRKEAKEAGCGSFKHENKDGREQYLWEEQTKDLETQFLLAEKVLKTGRNEIREREGVVIKSFQRPRGWKQLMYSWWRKSKARRSYEIAQELGHKTPMPIGYKEKRRHGLLTESYYACRLSELPYTFKDLRDPAFPDRERHLRAIARFTAELHESGLLHRDYSQGNILFDEEDHIEIVDLNRVRHRKHISIEEGIRNMERLHLSDDEMFRILTDEYSNYRKKLAAHATI